MKLIYWKKWGWVIVTKEHDAVYRPHTRCNTQREAWAALDKCLGIWDYR